MLKGVDVSKYQGKIDWEKVKPNIDFAILRAGWGAGSIDGAFKRNADECTRLEIPFGVYWFSYAYTPEMARKEAFAVLKAIEGYRLHYPICFDFEYDSTSYAAKKGVIVNKQLVSDMARAFLDVIEAAGYDAANYTNLDYFKRYFDDDVNTRYPVWFAYWGSSNKWTDASALWQYSSKGRITGISGNVDLDYDNTNYMGKEPQEVIAVSTNTPTVTVAHDKYKIPAAWTLVFDPDWYYDHYIDLREWIKNSEIANDKEAVDWRLFQHFYYVGMSEASNGRRGNVTFDVVKYRNAMPDLREAFGDEWRAYYTHYITCGAREIAEGKRRAF